MPDLAGFFLDGLTAPGLGVLQDGSAADYRAGQTAPALGVVADGVGADFRAGQTPNTKGDQFSGMTASAATGVTYRMRARDGTLARDVFWNATVVDATGAQYAGPGPLTNIVVFKVIPS